MIFHQIIKIKVILFIISLTFLVKPLFSQCSNFVVQYPPSTFSTTSTSLEVISYCMYGGEYSVCSVVLGETYVWTTCGDTDFDSQITIWNTSHTISYVYNDDDCGLQSTVSWTATFTGNVHVLISRYNCGNYTSCMTLSWAILPSEITVPLTGSNSYNICSGTIYGHAGSTLNYDNNISGYTVLNGENPGDLVEVTGELVSEANYDYLYIWDGNTISGNLLWSGSGFLTIPLISSTSGPLTIQFISDGSVRYSGFYLDISCSNPLPVELTNFMIKFCDNGVISLGWSTASEQNSDYFILQKSCDGFYYFNIDTIKANGFSNVNLNYEYIDNNPCNEDNYYRLIEVDIDGNKEIFSPQYIYCNRSMGFILYPNPTSGILNIEFQKKIEELTEIYLYDSSGKIIYENLFYGNSHKIDMTYYSNGEYIIIISNKEGSIVKKIIKL